MVQFGFGLGPGGPQNSCQGWTVDQPALGPAEPDLDLGPNPVQFEVRTQSASSRTGLRQL
jgi:hypothetical protein